MEAHRNVPASDLIGRSLDADERELAELYLRLEALSGRRDLPPCVLMNVRQAFVMLWNACTDLDLMFEEPDPD